MRVLALLCAAVVSNGCTNQPSHVPGQPAGTNPAGAGQPAAAAPLEAGAMRIHAVSPDGKRVLVSHQRISYAPYDAGDLALVTAGEPTRTLTAHGTVTARFSPDGSSIVFDTGNGVGSDLNLACADGGGVRQLAGRSSYHSFAGRWLYYTDEAGGPASLYRLLPPDGAPELIASFAPPHDADQPIYAAPSPDGESVAYCHYGSAAATSCFLLPAGSSTAVQLRDGIGVYPAWTADGSWLLTGDCDLIDRAGRARTVCDPASTFYVPSPDGKKLAMFVRTGAQWPPPPDEVDVHVYTIATGADVALPKPGEFNPGVFRPASSLSFTPDGSRLIAMLGGSAFTAPTAGGAWTLISSDIVTRPNHGTAVASPDSRAIVVPSNSLSVFVSVDGGPPYPVGPPDRKFMSASLPLFEPLGGKAKAIFFAAYNKDAYLANADGSGYWAPVPGVDACQWTGRAALCLGYDFAHPDAPPQAALTVITDEGKQVASVTAASDWALIPGKLFYTQSTGGLYELEAPQP